MFLNCNYPNEFIMPKGKPKELKSKKLEIKKGNLTLIVDQNDNIYFVQAYAGFGVGPSHLVAKSLAAEISGEVGYFRILSKIRHPKIFASTALNSLWVTAGKCWHQLEAKLH